MKLYLDVCCLNRPFDAQGADRVRLESQAVVAILDLCIRNEHEWCSSEVVEDEILRSPDPDRRMMVWSMLRHAASRLEVREEHVSLAGEFITHGLHAMDALHLAVAESYGGDILMTTDDLFIRKAKRLASLRVRVVNPVAGLAEIAET